MVFFQTRLKWKMKSGIIIIAVIIFILLANIVNATIIASNQEVFKNGNSNNLIAYSDNPFINHKGTWYDLTSFADISTISNGFNVSYLKNNSAVLQPYVVYLGNKIPFSSLPVAVSNAVSFNANAKKDRNTFKFGNNFSLVFGMTEIGFDIKTARKITTSGNKTIIDGLIMIDYSDLIKKNYTIFVNDTLIKITNLKNGFNDLDPLVQFNSTSKSGRINGVVNGTGNGLLVNTVESPSLAGYEFVDLEDRVFLNFNTSSLGSNAVISEANLFINVEIHKEEDEFAQPCHLGDWNYDIKNGTFIGASLDVTDYSKGDFGLSFPISSTGGKVVGITTDINKTGETDFAIKPIFAHTSLCAENNEITMPPSVNAGNRPYLNITYKIFKQIYDTENITWFPTNASSMNILIGTTLSTNFTMNGSSNPSSFISRFTVLGLTNFHSKDYYSFPNITMWDYNITTNTTMSFFCNTTGANKLFVSGNISLFNVSGNNLIGLAKTTSGNSRACNIGSLSGNETIQINTIGSIIPYNYRLAMAFNGTIGKLSTGIIEIGTSNRSNISFIMVALNGFSNITIENTTSGNINTNLTSLFQTNISCSNGRCGNLSVELFYNTTSNINLQPVNYTSLVNYTFLQNQEGLYCGNLSDVSMTVENTTCSLLWNLTARRMDNYSILANVTWINSTVDNKRNNTLISNVLYVTDAIQIVVSLQAFLNKGLLILPYNFQNIY